MAALRGSPRRLQRSVEASRSRCYFPTRPRHVQWVSRYVKCGMSGRSRPPVRRTSRMHMIPRRMVGYRPAMGMQNYLVEGVSGTGKTSVCQELRRRGFHAINGDTDLAYQGDPETGEPTDGVPSHWHHIWHVDKVRALVADQNERVTFFCGGSRNFSKFQDLFDSVFVLEIDLDTLNRRLDQRPEDEFGAQQSERDLIAAAASNQGRHPEKRHPDRRHRTARPRRRRDPPPSRGDRQQQRRSPLDSSSLYRSSADPGVRAWLPVPRVAERRVAGPQRRASPRLSIRGQLFFSSSASITMMPLGPRT